MDHSKKSTYLFSIDALRVIAILAVILIHVTTKTLATLKLNVEVAPFSLFLNQSARFAVPLFFLISGFVLELNNKEGLSYFTFFKKRASRIIIPFLFWTLLYFLIGNGYNFSHILSQNFVMTTLLGTASYHLYFIPTLILFYLAFPFLHALISYLKNPFILLMLVIVQGVLLYYDYYIESLKLNYDLRIAVLSVAMFVIGMVASHFINSIQSIVKKLFLPISAFLIFLLFFIFFHVFDITLKLKTSRFIYNQYSPLNYLYTATLTSLLFVILEKTQFARKIFIGMSKLSFFVFFIHVLIQTLLWENIVTKLIDMHGNWFLASIWFDLLFFASVAAISFGIAYLVHKISIAPRITG